MFLFKNNIKALFYFLCVIISLFSLINTDKGDGTCFSDKKYASVYKTFTGKDFQDKNQVKHIKKYKKTGS